MKKINMIVGKKQIVLAALVVILGVAVYLNWEFAKNDGQFDITTGATSNKNYGDTALVNKTDDYFTQAHLDKQKTRDTAVETFAKQLKDDGLSAAEMKTVKKESAALDQQIKAEANIETRVKEKGFADCLAYLDDDKARLIVKTDGLKAEQAAQLKAIILDEAKVLNEDISIVEKK